MKIKIYFLTHSYIYIYFPTFIFLHLCSFFSTVSKRGVCNISGKYFSNNQTLVSICSVLLVVLQSLIWQHAVLIWLLSHTTTKALNTWARVSWARHRMKPTTRDTGSTTAEDMMLTGTQEVTVCRILTKQGLGMIMLYLMQYAYRVTTCNLRFLFLWQPWGLYQMNCHKIFSMCNLSSFHI